MDGFGIRGRPAGGGRIARPPRPDQELRLHSLDHRPPPAQWFCPNGIRRHPQTTPTGWICARGNSRDWRQIERKRCSSRCGSNWPQFSVPVATRDRRHHLQSPPVPPPRDRCQRQTRATPSSTSIPRGQGWATPTIGAIAAMRRGPARLIGCRRRRMKWRDGADVGGNAVLWGVNSVDSTGASKAGSDDDARGGIVGR